MIKDVDNLQASGYITHIDGAHDLAKHGARQMPKQTYEARAEQVADALREFSAKADALSWELDSALSAINKDRAGYRTGNAANRTGGANSLPGELESAVAAAEAFLAQVATVAQPVAAIKLAA